MRQRLDPHRGPPRLPQPTRTIENPRSEEHTSELQSQSNLVCRLLLEKKKTIVVELVELLIAHRLVYGLDRDPVVRRVLVQKYATVYDLHTMFTLMHSRPSSGLLLPRR